MRLLRLLALVGCLASPLLSYGQKEDWLPVSAQDLQVKQVPGDAGASAIQLYYADYIDDTDQSEFFYHRIKILNDKGNKNADIEIEVPFLSSVGSLKARTIHPDGQIIEFSGKPFQKTLIKGRGIKIIAKTFTMPDVVPGSIIEYKYRIIWPFVFTENSWTIQHDLYTLKEDFRMKPYQGMLEDFGNGFRVSATYSQMPNELKPVLKNGVYEMEAQNIRAFDKEGYMPPEDDYKPQVRFFYLPEGASTVDKFWQDTSQSLNSSVEHFIGNRKEVAEAAAQAVGNETDPEKKLRKLYERAQQIRNLTFERQRTEQEQKKESIKENQNAADVLGRGYGTRNDVTKTFVSMARASGFTASVLAVSNRRNRFFQRNVLAKRQLDAELALVSVNGKDVYLDPGTKFCPYGLVRWMYTSTMALKPDKKTAIFSPVPVSAPAQALTRRTGEFSLSAEGDLTGQLIAEYNGLEALELRLDSLDSDDAGRAKSLEDSLKELLPNGANVKLVDVKGWAGTEEPLVATYKIEVSSFATFAGKRALLPSFLFDVKQLDAFKHAERKYPVYFTYPFAEIDAVNITLPPGYKVDSLPAKSKITPAFGGYQSIAQQSDAKLNLQRMLVVGGIFFSLDHYPELKDFFNKVQAGDEQQAVLSGGNVSAEKSN